MLNNPAYDTFKLFRDCGDPWGEALSTQFTVAAELYFRNPEDVPAVWEYRPPMVADDPREHEDMLFADCAETSTSNLIAFGELLRRYVRRCELAGLSY